MGPKPGGTSDGLGGPRQVAASVWVPVAPSVTGSICVTGGHAPLTALLFFLLRLSLDQDECLLGAHDCSRRQFCVNTLGSFYCVNHTVLCAEGFILNVHRKCVGKPGPRLRHRPGSLLCSTPSPPHCGHMLKGLPFASELSARPPRSVSCPSCPGVLSCFSTDTAGKLLSPGVGLSQKCTEE